MDVDPGVRQLWEQLEGEEKKVTVEGKRLQDIWLKISAMHKANEEARAAFEKEAAFDFASPDTRVVLNVGGHIFETTAEVLCRDRFSLLAALCKTDPPVKRDESGAFFLDRDWWIFRYVLQFLRTGALPQDTALLKEMHEAASFYRINSLRRAVERRCAAQPSGSPPTGLPPPHLAPGSSSHPYNPYSNPAAAAAAATATSPLRYHPSAAATTNASAVAAAGYAAGYTYPPPGVGGRSTGAGGRPWDLSQVPNAMSMGGVSPPPGYCGLPAGGWGGGLPDPFWFGGAPPGSASGYRRS